MVEISEKQAFSIIQKAKDTGKIRIGINEVTKAIERGLAKLVISATDVSPSEIVAHLPGLCKEMKCVYASLGNKSELGSLVSIKSTSAICVTDLGSAKKDFEVLQKENKISSKKEDSSNNEEGKKKVLEQKEENSS